MRAVHAMNIRARRSVKAKWLTAIGALLLVIMGGARGTPQAATAPVTAPAGLTASDLAVIVNDDDPVSIQVGEYYRQRRGIPAQNLIHVRMPIEAVLSRAQFARVWSETQAHLPTNVQALALAWTQPYRVECMSITSAFAFGFDPKFCADNCQPTPFSAYFDSTSREPNKDFGIRPTMMIAARTIEQARALIDRGIASDGTAPRGTAYLLDTSDQRRSTRAPQFMFAQALERDGLAVRVIKADTLRDRSDVLFYFTGLIRVDGLRTNHFVAGAIADHLTSGGGVLVDGDQMSSLEWLEAGATASYGTVVEPCNYPGKFPNVPIVMRHYLDGETAIEAYWKSVLMPSQGLFIGEPLAAPYRAAHPARIRQSSLESSRPVHE